MSRPGQRARVIALAVVWALCACVSAHGDAAGRVIVKFKSDTVIASDPVLVNAMARAAQARLAYERALSGGAHLYRVTGMRTEAQLGDIAKRIAARAEVEYAEPDLSFGVLR